MSEAQPFLGLMAPIVWLTGSTIAAYNAYIVLSLTLNGWFARRLLIGQNFPAWIATMGGIGMLLLPVVHWQLGVSQLVPVWGIIWGWDVLLRCSHASQSRSDQDVVNEQTASPEGPASTENRTAPSQKPEQNDRHQSGLRLGVELGGAWIATFAMSVHHGLFATVMYAVAFAVWVLLRFRDRSFLTRMASAHTIAAILVGLVIGPMLWRHHRVNREYGFEREASLVEQLSVWPSQYLTTYGHSLSNWVVGQGWETQTGWTIGAGLLTTIVGVIGLVAGLFQSKYRRMALMLWAIILASFLFSLGNHLSIGDWTAWEILVKYVPGFAQVRSAYRFIYFLQIAIVLSASITIYWLAKGETTWRRCIAILIAILCAVDPWPCNLRLGTTPIAVQQRPEWIEILNKQPPGGVVVLPLLDGGNVHDYEIVTEWMLEGFSAEKPLVNGYSGFFPKTQLELAKRIYQNQLDRNSVQELNQLGVRYVVVSPFLQFTVDLDRSGLELIESTPKNWHVLRIPESGIKSE